MSAKALIDHNPEPTSVDVKKAIKIIYVDVQDTLK